MNRALIILLLAVALAAGGWFGLHHYGAARYEAGYAAAVAAGKEQHDADAVAALAIESGLRTRQAQQDVDHFKKEQEYATNLEAAQRRVRAGTDRLRCPASAVPAPAPADRGSAAAEPPADGAGPDLMPEAASDVLGYGAAVAGLVRRYQQVEERFEGCRAVNAR